MEPLSVPAMRLRVYDACCDLAKITGMSTSHFCLFEADRHFLYRKADRIGDVTSLAETQTLKPLDQG